MTYRHCNEGLGVVRIIGRILAVNTVVLLLRPIVNQVTSCCRRNVVDPTAPNVLLEHLQIICCYVTMFVETLTRTNT
jgi:hypothetical protein